MSLSFNRRRWALVGLLYVWWLLLSANYLWNFWRNPVAAGMDGSGHVAILQLYATHVYPDVQGWIPEFFGGMPFPVYYPPMFYWLGAALMKCFGLDATLTAKLLTTISFAALPATIFGLGRRLGLSRLEAFTASGMAGVIACGANAAAMFGVGIAGLFDGGLYTQTLGFVWFCLWCGALPHARRSRAAAAMTIIALAAVVLSNVHLLPLAAAYGIAWFALESWRAWRLASDGRAARFAVRTAQVSAWVVASVLLSSFWLLPLLKWYPYALGRPIESDWLLPSLGTLNVLWVACALVLWLEWRRRPALAALCVALLLTALASLTPVGQMFPWIPFQPWRITSSSVILATVPAALLLVRALRELLKSERRYLKFAVVVVLVGLAWFHPRYPFVIGSLPAADGARLGEIRAIVRGLPPGTAMVEVFEVSPGSGVDPRDAALSRALTHQIATDGRPVLWSIFREHAASAPFDIAARNLLSSSPEQFGIDGWALRRAADHQLSLEDTLTVCSRLGVAFYVVKSPEQVERLRQSPAVRYLHEVGGWHVFAAVSEPAASVEPSALVPTLAWLPARFKNRSPDELDFFNLGEHLAFDGHPNAPFLWALSPDTSPWDVAAQAARVNVVVAPSAVTSPQGEWLKTLTTYGAKLNVLLLDDGSELSARIQENQGAFRSFERLDANGGAADHRLDEAAHVMARWYAEPLESLDSPMRLWYLNTTYFPAWHTDTGSALWLTGQGRMAALATAPPQLRWHTPAWRATALKLSLTGCLFAVLNLCFTKRRKKRRHLSGSGFALS